MPGPRRTLAVAVCAAVVGLFCVVGVGVAQASAQHRVTTVQASAATHHGAHVRCTSDHTDQLDLDLWCLPPTPADPATTLLRGTAQHESDATAPAGTPRPVVRGPPTA